MTTHHPEPTVRTWPIWILGLPAGVAIWSGWVGLGQMTGFGKINPLPGTPFAGFQLDTAITLPVGMEVYAAYALWVWLSRQAPPRAESFARLSAWGALILGAAGQVAYHLMAAAGWTRAPWWITTVVACIPVAVLGMGAALRHLIHATPAPVPVPQFSSPAAPSLASGEEQTSTGRADDPPAGVDQKAAPGESDGSARTDSPPTGPRGRSTTSRPAQRRGTAAPAGRTTQPSREEVAEDYVRDRLASQEKPTAAGLLAELRSRTGSGMRDEALRNLLREATAKHSGMTPASPPPALHAVNGMTPGEGPGGIPDEVSA